MPRKERCLVAEETGARLLHGTGYRFEQKKVTTMWQAMYKASEQVNMRLIYIMCGSRGGGGRGPDTLPEKSKKIGFFGNTGVVPLKNHKATKPAFNIGPSSARKRNAI